MSGFSEGWTCPAGSSAGELSAEVGSYPAFLNRSVACGPFLRTTRNLSIWLGVVNKRTTWLYVGAKQAHRRVDRSQSYRPSLRAFQKTKAERYSKLVD